MRAIVLGMLRNDFPEIALVEGMRAVGIDVVANMPMRMIERYMDEDCGLGHRSGEAGDLVEIKALRAEKLHGRTFRPGDVAKIAPYAAKQMIECGAAVEVGRDRMGHEGLPLRLVQRMILSLDIELVLIYNYPSMRAEDIKWLQSKGCTVAWYYMDPYPLLQHPRGLPAMRQYDLVLCHGEQIAAECRDMGARRAEVLYPCSGGCSTVQEPLPWAERDIDVLLAFTSSYRDGAVRDRAHTDRIAVAQAVMEAGKAKGWNVVAVGKWDKWDGLMQVEQLSARDLFRLRTRVKVEVNAHARIGCRHYCNHRFLEIPSCGIAQVCDRVNDLHDLMEPDKEILFYGTPSGAVDQIAQALSDRGESIAKGGLERAEFCYDVGSAGIKVRTYVEEIRG